MTNGTFYAQLTSALGLGESVPNFPTVSMDAWCDTLLEAIAAHVVGNRPDRFEPRLRKRRPKPYKHLREPRQNYKRRVA
jgi:putative transposase